MTLLYDALTFEFLPNVTEGGRQCVRLKDDFFIGGILIPRGFVSDLASVPWFADGLFPSFGPYVPAAIPHDYLYRLGGKLPDGRVFTRAQADRLFLDIMAELGVPWWKRSVMYRAVRIGGTSGWVRA